MGGVEADVLALAVGGGLRVATGGVDEAPDAEPRGPTGSVAAPGRVK